MHIIHNDGLMRQNSSVVKRNKNLRKCVECIEVKSTNSWITRQNLNVVREKKNIHII